MERVKLLDHSSASGNIWIIRAITPCSKNDKRMLSFWGVFEHKHSVIRKRPRDACKQLNKDPLE